MTEISIQNLKKQKVIIIVNGRRVSIEPNALEKIAIASPREIQLSFLFFFNSKKYFFKNSNAKSITVSILPYHLSKSVFLKTIPISILTILAILKWHSNIYLLLLSFIISFLSFVEIIYFYDVLKIKESDSESV